MTYRKRIANNWKKWFVFWTVCTVINFTVVGVAEIFWDTEPEPPQQEFTIEAVYSVDGDVDSAIYWTEQAHDPWEVERISSELMSVEITVTDVTQGFKNVRSWPDNYPDHTGETLEILEADSTVLPLEKPHNWVPITAGLYMQLFGTFIVLFGMLIWYADEGMYQDDKTQERSESDRG